MKKKVNRKPHHVTAARKKELNRPFIEPPNPNEKRVNWSQRLIENMAKSGSADPWKEAGKILFTYARNHQEYIADWILEGGRIDRDYDEVRKIALATTGKRYGIGTLYNMASTARAVPISFRNETLTWKHYVVVARLKDDEEKRKWLAFAVQQGIGANELRRRIEPPKPRQKKKLTFEVEDYIWSTLGFIGARYSSSQTKRFDDIQRMGNPSEVAYRLLRGHCDALVERDHAAAIEENALREREREAVAV